MRALFAVLNGRCALLSYICRSSSSAAQTFLCILVSASSAGLNCFLRFVTVSMASSDESGDERRENKLIQDADELQADWSADGVIEDAADGSVSLEKENACVLSAIVDRIANHSFPVVATSEQLGESVENALDMLLWIQKCENGGAAKLYRRAMAPFSLLGDLRLRRVRGFASCRLGAAALQCALASLD